MGRKTGPGRPKKYTTAKALTQAVNAYFDGLLTERGTYRRAPSVAGLCLHLGISRSTWYAYAGDPRLGPVTEWARLTVEEFWSDQLAGKFANGAKFALGCGFGWNERGIWREQGERDDRDGDRTGVVEIGRVLEAPEDG